MFCGTDKNGTLTIYHTDYQRDTGAYKCVAENTAGRAEDVATIFIHKPNETMHSKWTVPRCNKYKFINSADVTDDKRNIGLFLQESD